MTAPDDGLISNVCITVCESELPGLSECRIARFRCDRLSLEPGVSPLCVKSCSKNTSDTMHAWRPRVSSWIDWHDASGHGPSEPPGASGNRFRVWFISSQQP